MEMKMSMEIVKSKEKLISPTDTISQTQTGCSYNGGSTCDLRLAAFCYNSCGQQKPVIWLRFAQFAGSLPMEYLLLL